MKIAIITFSDFNTNYGSILQAFALKCFLQTYGHEVVFIRYREYNKIHYNTFKDYKYVGDIRSLGLINAIELVEDKEAKTSFDPKKRIGYEIYKKALSKGLLLRPIGDILYFNPPLTIKADAMKVAVQTCLESIKEVLGE